MHGLAPGEGDRRGPEGVVRGRHEHLVAVVDQALHGHDDELGDAVTDEDVLHVHAPNALLLGALHHRLPRGVEALAVAVALGLRQVSDDVLKKLVGGFKAKGGGVADVQLQHPMPVFLQALRRLQHRASNVVANGFEFSRLLDAGHGAPRCVDRRLGRRPKLSLQRPKGREHSREHGHG